MVKEKQQITLDVETRAETGSANVNRLRRDGWLPAVIYGGDNAPQPLKLNRHGFEMLVRRHGGGQNLIIDMRIDGGEARKVLLKDVQHDAMQDVMVHADFQEISMTRRLRVDVAIHLVGEPRGVLQQGGVLEQLLRSVEVECLPVDIIQELELDVSGLDVGHSLFVRDLPLDASLSLITSGDIAVAAVHMPRVDEEPGAGEAEAAAEGEGAEKPEKGGAEGESAKPEAKEAKEKK